MLVFAESNAPGGVYSLRGVSTDPYHASKRTGLRSQHSLADRVTEDEGPKTIVQLQGVSSICIYTDRCPTRKGNGGGGD